MKTIYKYPFDRAFSNTIEMPTESKVITVQVQKDSICLWAIVNISNKETRSRTFVVIGTGHDVPAYHEYIGTVQVDEYVWHIFEKL